MKPTRAAWLFAAGLAWLVVRGMLVDAIPAIGTEHIAERGGVWLAIPFVSFIASMAAPAFFLYFYRSHEFGGETGFRRVTAAAGLASALSCGLVLVSLAAVVRGGDMPAGAAGSSFAWVSWAIPFLFVLAIHVFLLVLSRSDGIDRGIRSAGRVAAIGALIPVAMMLAWAVQSATGALPWYPDFSRGAVAKLLGLAAAGTLFMFLEAFATRYGSSVGDSG